MRISDWSSDVCSSDLVVPLDLFPTNVLETIEVQKTYSAKMPGEFGGGVINLSSAVIPEEAFLNIKLGTGGNSETTFQPGLTHYRSEEHTSELQSLMRTSYPDFCLQQINPHSESHKFNTTTKR